MSLSLFSSQGETPHFSASKPYPRLYDGNRVCACVSARVCSRYVYRKERMWKRRGQRAINRTRDKESRNVEVELGERVPEVS